MFWLLIIGAILFFGMGFIGLAALLTYAFNQEALKPESKQMILGIIAFSLAAGVALGGLAWYK